MILNDVFNVWTPHPELPFRAQIGGKRDNDSDDEEIVDCFDSVVVIQAKTIKSFDKSGVEAKQEITLSANIALTEQEMAHEQKRAHQILEAEDEFYNALVQRVL